MTLTEIVTLVKDVGFPLVLCLWFLWRADQKFIPAVEGIAEGVKTLTQQHQVMRGDLADIFGAVATLQDDVTELKEIVSVIPQCPLLKGELAQKKEAA